MLIDAGHPEETRVAVVSGTRIEEFDFEARAKKPLRGNIYLAKVTRVEPSLQAAFVDYGGNRHGFLAFSEIHPDYFQIPVADRQALIAQDEAADRREALEAATEDTPTGEKADETQSEPSPEDGEAAPVEAEAAPEADEQDTAPTQEPSAESGNGSEPGLVDVPADTTVTPIEPTSRPVQADIDDAFDEMPAHRRLALARPYKIHEVIKRRQILLVQVVKEERGNKGAALTTYLSLAGRYCVLMPNTARGGGISRKITNQGDRKRLKSAANELEIPQGMGLIIRTAGANRTKAEIKRDFEYLLRVWENVRELTLKSTAPALVYEEGSLIKRAIRDLYSKDIEAILVEGDEGYKEAKAFMRMLMPSHAKAVQPYKDRIPLLQRYQVENQLDAMFSPTVTLRSGGYLVINQTEALVAIDVNSGRSTREHSIESTALRTNLEAAEEVARQLRLRDLAGLIVVDFIDMEESRNDRAVEKRLKDCLKADRARIQVGRISPFGLLEMSRQRLRTGVLEGSTVTCPHCSGRGIIRSVESAALHVLRAMEEEGMKERTAAMTVRVPMNVSLYILNHKRRDLVAIEERYHCTAVLERDDTLGASDFAIERTESREAIKREPEPTVRIEASYQAEVPEVEEAAPAEEAEERAAETGEEREGRRKRRRRKRRGRARPEGELRAEPREAEAEAAPPAEEHEAPGPEAQTAETGGAEPRRRRRRGRRGGRRTRRNGEQPSAVPGSSRAEEPQPEVFQADAEDVEPRFEPSREEPVAHEAHTAIEEPAERPTNGGDGHEKPPEIRVEQAPEPRTVETLEEAPPPRPEHEESEDDQPRRRGWWQRRFGG
jgi:ribonuclease E